MSAYLTYSDSELISFLKEGNHEAYTVIYQRYSGVLYMHAYKRLGNREDARDIIQELFTVLWNKRSDFTIHTSLSAYLYTSIRNRIIKEISHKKIENQYLDSLPVHLGNVNVQTDFLVRERELSSIIEKEINCLPTKMRKIFKLSREMYLSHREIAEELDLSEATVKKQVNNALKVLRAKLELLMCMIWMYFCLFF